MEGKMAFNYDEAIAELRQEEKRLLEELEQVRASIPGLIILRNRNRGKMISAPETVIANPTLPGIGRFAGTGATQAIQEVLKSATIAMTNREIYAALCADGWTTEARRPQATVAATLAQLAEKEIVERVGEGWKIKVSAMERLNAALTPIVARLAASASQQPS